jgi:hypothetical protein
MNKLFSVFILLFFSNYQWPYTNFSKKIYWAGKTNPEICIRAIATTSETLPVSPTTDTYKNEQKFGKGRTEEAITLDTFSILPGEIEGCSCYLSEKDEKKGKYIFVNDFGKVAFVSINGKIKKFVLQKKESENVFLYSNGLYDINVAIEKRTNDGYEGSRIIGVIKLIKGKNILVLKKFMGTCGC